MNLTDARTHYTAFCLKPFTESAPLSSQRGFVNTDHYYYTSRHTQMAEILSTVHKHWEKQNFSTAMPKDNNVPSPETLFVRGDTCGQKLVRLVKIDEKVSLHLEVLGGSLNKFKNRPLLNKKK